MFLNFWAVRLALAFIVFGVGQSLVTVAPASATPLNSWRVSCGADPGAITQQGNVRTFRTSTNHCPGGIFVQRAEIQTDSVSPSHKGAYLFESVVAMSTRSTEKFGVFQIHDGRLGCAPPLVVYVEPSGRMSLTSDIKTGPGESCVRGALNAQVSQGRLHRDGREQTLRVLVEFDGQGGFVASLFLDGILQISGQYDSTRQPAAYRAQKFYFKHGVYSQRMFDYAMTSRDMAVRRVRVKR